MKLQSLLTFFSLLLAFSSSNAQTTISGIVNNYTPVLGFFDCDRSLLQVGSAAGFSAGDEVLIIQMQGATVNTSNTANFGDVIGFSYYGFFELNRIKSISGNEIRLLYKPERPYNVDGKVQLIRVPEYDDVTANSLTCKAWDGSTGGVLIIDVAGTLTLQGNLDVSEKGFRGGIVQDADASIYHETDYFYSPDPFFAAAKGEGIAIIPTNLSYGRGKVANGGGGGNAHNAGGGGGGNGGAGGNGGYEYWFPPNSPNLETNGIGGDYFGAALFKIILGGGGGAGHTNDNVGTSGGNGGGIIILKANNIVAEGSNVVVAANGGNVVTTGDGNNDGQGGGGAGGSILIQANQVVGTLNCEAKGGRGGDCLFYVQEQIIGPGGGGGGGVLLLSQDFPNISANLDGGVNGIANQNYSNGAKWGQPGMKGLGVSILEDSTLSGPEFIEQDVIFCPGSSVIIDGVTYNQPGTVVDTIPAGIGCDKIITYHLQYSPMDLVFDIEEVFCQNGSIKLSYSICNLGSGPLPNQVRVLFTTVNPTVEMATTSAILKFDIANPDTCQTGSITISGLPVSDIVYSVVNFDGSLPTPFSFDDFPVTNIEECNYTNNLDSILFQLPSPPTLDLGPDVILCVDSTVVFDAGAGFYKYLWQDGSTSKTFFASQSGYYWVEVTDSCGFTQHDTVLLTFSLLPDTQFPDMEICPGESVSLSLPGFDTYIWSPPAGLSCTDCADVTVSPSATTTYALLATTTDGCILKDTFTVEVLPNPIFSTTIEFCKGDTVFIGGMPHTQPGTVVFTLPATVGCDTIATYILKYLDDPNASVSINCVDDIDIASQPGTGPIVVNYDLPTYASDCPCPGVALTLTEGLPPGSLFPVTTTKVCYQAKDSCGNTATCCFNVTIREEQPCDVKQIGCMKYELLSITRNASNLRLTYKIRVTNSCTNKMVYSAFQLPDGIVAKAPANNSIFTTQAGRDYEVRNPNYSPFYSIRFKSKDDGITNGQSDIFEYTLPPQINPTYIHVTSKLEPQQFFEAHLNTFYCPIELVNSKTAQRSDDADLTAFVKSVKLNVFPNPTNGSLFADLSGWQGEQAQIQVYDAQGRRVQHSTATANDGLQEIQLSENLADGLYFLEIQGENGEKQAVKFVLKR